MASKPSPSNSSSPGGQQTPSSPAASTQAPSNSNSGQGSGGQSYAGRVIGAIVSGVPPRTEGRTIIGS